MIHLLKELYLEIGEERDSVQFLSPSFIQAIIDTQKTSIYLIATTSNTIGLLTLTTSQAIYAGGEYGVLDEMYIIPAFRSKAAGARAIDAIIKIGKEKNWKRIDVTAPTDDGWKRTVDFYLSAGFVHTGPKLKLLL